MTAAPAVEVEDLTVTLGGVRALDAVSTAVPEGSLVGLVGPNGAGKTTLIRTIAGVEDPDAGRVRVGGREIHELGSKAASRRVAVVPQETSLAFDFPVRDVVAMGRHPHRPRFGADPDPELVERALERTDTARFADRPATEVSGGERGRVLLARAIAQDAPVLLLDEPTASLDVTHRIRTFELVRELVAEGRTVLAAIHDLDLAARYCDELRLLADGRLLDAGPPAEVLTEATLREAFGGRAVVARDPVSGTPHVTALPDRPDRGASVHVVGGGGAAAPLLYPLVAAGFDVTVGVAAEGDRDAETAAALGLDAVTVPPFVTVDDGAKRRAERRAREADATVLADVDLGRGVLPNLDVAAAGGDLVCVEARPPETRSSDPGPRGRYESLRARARVVDSVDALPAAVADLLADDAPADAREPGPGR